MSFGDRLRHHRKMKGLTQEELGERVGIGKSTISEWESDKRSPDVERLPEIAQALGILAKELLDDSKYYPAELLAVRRKRIPLLGNVAAGVPIFADEDLDTHIAVDYEVKCDFALKVVGDSMVNARINDGDVVFIREQPDVRDGEIAAVIIDDSATLKRVYHISGGVTLVSENPKYAPMTFTLENSEHVRIIGKVVAFQSCVG